MKRHIACVMYFVLSCVSPNPAVSGADSLSYALPDLLISTSGKKITNTVEWMQSRRPEIVRLFETFVYGKVPTQTIRTQVTVTKTVPAALHGKARLKEVTISLSNGKETVPIHLLLLLPLRSVKPVPLFIGPNFNGNHTIHADTNITAGGEMQANGEPDKARGSDAPGWPVERILERGYGVATLWYGDIDPDFNDGFQNGIHPLFYREGQTKPRPDEWGSIGAWAYGLSKAMDYLVTDAEVDPKRVALFGHSRLGKTALWAGAIDTRFALVISNNSGCGGAALARRKHMQTIKDINRKFSYWFCGNFTSFNDREDSLPVDQHMLIGLIAPRAVYVASAERDKWADTYGEYLSLYHAGPVYELFGTKALASRSLPAIDRTVSTGKMGYHIRSGEHGITLYDWEQYLNFADVQFKEKRQ